MRTALLPGCSLLEVKGGSESFWHCTGKGLHFSRPLPRQAFLGDRQWLQEGASSYLELSYLPGEVVLTAEGPAQDKDLWSGGGRRGDEVKLTH